MYTVNVSTPLVRQIDDKVTVIINNIREKSRKLLSNCQTYDELSQKLDEYIMSCCDAEIRSISSSVYFDLYGQTSKSRIFSDPELVSEFYALDMRNYLNENCQFKMDNHFSCSYRNRQKLSVMVGGGIAVGGSVISLLLMLPIGIVPSVMVGAVSYPITFKTVEKSNLTNYLVSVELYLKELQSAFNAWVQNLESFYCSTVEDMLCKVNYYKHK
jgi:hypothetical protein